MRFKGPKWYRARDYRRQAEMDGVADGVMKREQGKRAIGKETKKGGRKRKRSREHEIKV